MTREMLLWGLFLLVSPLVLALPFYRPRAPARRDRHCDIASAASHEVPVDPGAPVSAGSSLHLLPGARFGQLQAGRIVLGTGPAPAAVPLPQLERWQPPVSARPWGVKGWHIAHGLDIPPGHRVPCALVVRGQLNVHGPGVIEGDLKVRDNLRLGAGCQVHGNLSCEGDIHIGPGCHIRGLVMAEGRLRLSPGVVIGTAAQPVSVCADVIDAEGPVLIHGSVHARIEGGIAPGLVHASVIPAHLHHKDKP